MIVQNAANITIKIERTTNVTSAIELIIYSNRTPEIENDYSLFNQLIDVIPKDNTYHLSFDTLLFLKPGLYYLIMRRINETKILHISSFKVKS